MADAVQISPELFQEFLEVLAGVDHLAPQKQRELLISYAEVKYRVRGGGRCPLCRTPVRHVMPVYAIHLDGTEHSYPCLCTRCFEGEKGLSSKLVLRLGPSSLIYERNERERFDVSVMKNS